MTGVERIAAERRRQIDVEGWTPEYDAEHDDGALAHAARCYVQMAEVHAQGNMDDDNWPLLRYRPPLNWPWEREAWKPTREPIPNLVKAGALIAAEIDRLEATA